MAVADNLFDRVPFDSGPDSALRPDQLALTAWLHGGPVPPIERYRYLDLGCGGAVGLLSLAYYNPQGIFVGVDTSAAQIGAARSAAKQLGLRNVSLEVADARELSDGLGGPFDYVVACELLPYLDGAAGSEILATCRAQLAPNGLCCVSINSAPGWAVRRLLRDALRRAVEGIDAPDARTERARVFAEWLAGTIPRESQHPFHLLLAGELEILARSSPAQLLHYYLSGGGAIESFGELVADAAQRDLTYIGEATFNRPEGLPREALRTAVGAGGLSGSAQEEVLDLLAFSSSRTPLLCATSAERRSPLDGAGLATADVHVACSLAPESESVSLEPRVEVSFGAGGKKLSFTAPLVKAGLLLLGQGFPRGATISELLAEAGALLRAGDISGADTEPQRREVLDTLLALHRNGLAELRLWEPTVASVDPASPAVCSHELARHEAARYPFLTTPFHAPLPANDLVLLVASRLAPGWQRTTLIDELVKSVIAGKPAIDIDGERATNADELRPIVDELFERALTTLAAWGLLSEG